MPKNKGRRQQHTAHQNRHAFRHNPGSKKTKRILESPNQGLCGRCHEQIEWRKRYRKYKPLTIPRRCDKCAEKKVKRAYHTLCVECAKALGVCAKCKKDKTIIRNIKTPEEEARKERILQDEVRSMNERQRRTFLRKMERGDFDDEGDDTTTTTTTTTTTHAVGGPEEHSDRPDGSSTDAGTRKATSILDAVDISSSHARDVEMAQNT